METSSFEFDFRRPHRCERGENGFLHRRIKKISQVSTLVKNGQLTRRKRRMQPEQVVVSQEKIILIGDDADVGIRAQAGFIRSQIARFFHHFSRRIAKVASRIIRNGKLVKIVLIRKLQDFLIRRVAPEIVNRVV